jgi:hypothetical protein
VFVAKGAGAGISVFVELLAAPSILKPFVGPGAGELPNSGAGFFVSSSVLVPNTGASFEMEDIAAFVVDDWMVDDVPKDGTTFPSVAVVAEASALTDVLNENVIEDDF